MARQRLPGGVQLEQLLGHVAHRLADALLGLLPARSPQLVERCVGSAGVLLQQVELFHWDKQLVASGVAQLDEFLCGTSAVVAEVAETDERADAVLYVNHMVPGLQIAEVRQERPGDRFLLMSDQMLVVEQVRLGIDLQLGIGQTKAA